MRIKRILSLFALGIITLLLFFVRSSSSIDCTLYGGYCQEPGGSINVEHWYNPHKNALGYTVCNHFVGTHTWTCDKDPDDAHCDSTGFYYWLSSDDCVDENSQTSQSAGCCGSSGTPSPPSPPSCTPHCLEEGYTHYEDPPSISTSVASITTYQYSDCGEAEKCYRCNAGCGACNPDVGEYDSPQPANTYTVSTCTYTNTSCSTSSKYCFHECPEPTCKYLYSQTGIDTWVDGGCPTGDENCVEVTMPVDVPIPNGNDKFPNYPVPLESGGSYIDYTCTQEETLTCHLPNINPNVVSIDAERINPEDYKFAYQWDRFSGKDFNNPVRVTASYEDGDGSDDIIALYVWWTWDSDTAKSFLTPKDVYQQLDLNGQSTNEHNYGLMIARSYTSSDWSNARVYIPDHSTTPAYWVDIGSVSDTLTGSLAIDNSNNSTNPLEDDFVLITDIDITPISSQKRVDLSLNMYFVNDKDNSPISAYVVTRNYHLWGSVNDRIGYLPFNVPYYQNNYPDTAYHILDSGNDAWQDRGLDQAINNIDPTWHVDIINPEGDIVGKVVDSEHEQVQLEISAEDNSSGLSYVRLDACKSGKDVPKDLIYDSDGDMIPDEESSYYLPWCTDVENDDGYDIPNNNMTTGTSLLGNKGGYPDYPLEKQGEFTEFAYVGLGGNLEGSITFYLTVMDMAGNVSKQKSQTYLLEQWAVVEDALVFGREGAISMTRTLDDSIATFGASPVLANLRYPKKYDFTNQALLGKLASISHGLDSLINTLVNRSFEATKYPGQTLTAPTAYGELKEAYENKSSNSDFEEQTIELGSSKIFGIKPTSLGSLRDLDGDGAYICNSPYCIWIIELTNPSDIVGFGIDFTCNGKGLILVNGNVGITPDFRNGTGEDACIIIANGDITIQPTGAANGLTTTPPPYDTVEAFLIANGHIEIPNTVSNPPDDRGLFVEGGLVGFTQEDQTNSSVVNRREIYYANMGRYPVLVVQGNSKYGMLGKQLFGSQIDIYQSLQGFKP